MRRKLVFGSKSIVSIGYESSLQRLEIEFRSGRVHEYFMVPEAVYRALVDAESKGEFFRTMIREKYPQRVVTP